MWRPSNSASIATAKNRSGKTLASFDFAALPDPGREPIEPLAGSTDWTRQARNVLLFGAGGAAKTRLAERSVRVRYFATTALVQQLQPACEQLRLEETPHKLDRYPVVILDRLRLRQEKRA